MLPVGQSRFVPISRGRAAAIRVCHLKPKHNE